MAIHSGAEIFCGGLLFLPSCPCLWDSRRHLFSLWECCHWEKWTFGLIHQNFCCLLMRDRLIEPWPNSQVSIEAKGSLTFLVSRKGELSSSLWKTGFPQGSWHQFVSSKYSSCLRYGIILLLLPKLHLQSSGGSSNSNSNSNSSAQ